MEAKPYFGCKELRHRGIDFFKTMPTDCQFEVEQKTIPAHMIVLAIASPVFETMFHGSIPAGDGPIVVTDIAYDVFKIMVDYIYNNQFYSLTCELPVHMVYQLYYAAHKYMLTYLMQGCVAYLKKKLTPFNAARTLEFAEMFGERKLSKECYTVIVAQTKDVLNSEDFVILHLDTVEKIFSLGFLAIDECDLFKAAVKYATAQEEGRGYDASPSFYSVYEGFDFENIDSEPENDNFADFPNETEEEEYNSEELSKPESSSDVQDLSDEEIQNLPIRKILRKINFSLMTPKQFAKGPASSKFLTDSEKLAFFINISHPKTCVPYPSEFEKINRWCLEIRDEETETMMYCRRDGMEHGHVLGRFCERDFSPTRTQ